MTGNVTADVHNVTGFQAALSGTEVSAQSADPRAPESVDIEWEFDKHPAHRVPLKPSRSANG
jgi:hypothetical protein